MKSFPFTLMLGLCLSSCAVQLDPVNLVILDNSVQNPPPVVVAELHPPEPKQRTEMSEAPTKPASSAAITIPLRPVVVGCAPFVNPTIPYPPRVSTEDLAKIKRNDSVAMNDVLLENIAALNKYADTVRKLYADAYAKHRATCPGQKK